MATKALPADYITGDFEVELPTPWLDGTAGIEYHELGEAPSRLIDTKDDWIVEVDWTLKGSLTRFIAGAWCVQVFMESIGPGDELTLPAVSVPLDPGGTGDYHTSVTVPGGAIKVPTTLPTQLAVPYKVVVTINYVDPTGKPGPIAGIIEGPVVQFYPME